MLNRDTLDGKALLAETLFLLGKFDESFALCKEIDESYDYSEYKFGVRLVMTQMLAQAGKIREAKNLISRSEKLCRTNEEKMLLTLCKGKIEFISGNEAQGEALYAQALKKYPEDIEANLKNAYTSKFDLYDIYYLAEVAKAKNDKKLLYKLYGFTARLLAVKADPYVRKYIDIAEALISIFQLFWPAAPLLQLLKQ